MKVTISEKKQLNFFKGFKLSILLVLFGVLFVFPADAYWVEPSQPAPQRNVARPLNEDTTFLGNNSLISGSFYSSVENEMTLTVKKCDPGEILMWVDDDEEDSGDWECQVVGGEADDLLSVLVAGSDAKSFDGDVHIGDVNNSANLYLGGGELKAKWLHATAEEGDSTIASNLLIGGLVGIGTDSPQVELDVIGNIKLGNPANDMVGMIFSGDSDGFDKVFAIDNTPNSDILAYWDWDNNFIFETGNIGIGIYHPSAKIQVNSDSDDDLMLLQKGEDDQFKVDYQGITTASDFCLADGSLCLSTGLEFVGRTTNTHNGNVGGYVGANELCRTEISDPNPDNHVCTADEIIHLIRTDRFPKEPDVYGWIVKGPPGYQANANDCGGWVESDGEYLGPVWVFNETGGKGNLTTCNVHSYYPFLCCR